MNAAYLEDWKRFKRSPAYETFRRRPELLPYRNGPPESESQFIVGKNKRKIATIVYDEDGEGQLLSDDDDVCRHPAKKQKPGSTTGSVLQRTQNPQRFLDTPGPKALCYIRYPGIDTTLATRLPTHFKGALVLPLKGTSMPSSALRKAVYTDTTPINEYNPEPGKEIVIVKRCKNTLPPQVRGKPLPDVAQDGRCKRIAEPNVSGLCKRCGGRK